MFSRIVIPFRQSSFLHHLQPKRVRTCFNLRNNTISVRFSTTAATTKSSAPIPPSTNVSIRPKGWGQDFIPKARSGPSGVRGNEYILTQQEIDDYHKKGYIRLTGVLSEEEVSELEKTYTRFMTREIHVPGKDLCDMSGDFDRKFEDYNIINCMLPRVYHPSLKGNIYELRTQSITDQLFGKAGEFGIDYDQFLAKKPSKDGAIFAWHCDMAYWPRTPDTRTATFSLAIDPTTKANGCLRFVDGSHLEGIIRAHVPINSDRSKAHAIACRVNERTSENPDGEVVTYCEVPRGGVTVHNELVVHGSGGNFTQGWRRTYVVAYRTKETIGIERKAGFTHSHNDTTNWDTFNQWQHLTS